VGITIARITNDLSSVRNWVSMGIAPVTVGLPLIVGTTVALWLLSPPLAVAMALLTRPAFDKARTLRRKRGRLSAQVSDTVAATVSVRAAGEGREVQQIQRLGGEVAAAIDRARVGGYIRASAGVSGALTVAIVAATGSWLSIHTATTAAALTLIGLLASHVTDLGRVAEYRQSFNAAKRMIGPALPPAISAEPAKQEPRDPTADNPGAAARTGTEAKAPADLTVRISGLRLSGNRLVPDLVAYPGDRILLKTVDPGEATELFEALLALREDPPLDTWVGDRDLRSVSGAERRGLRRTIVRVGPSPAPDRPCHARQPAIAAPEPRRL
jgi:hypothetical protein